MVYRDFHRRNSPKRVLFYAASTGHVPVTLGSPTGIISKDGGAFANCTNLPVAVSNGLYYLDLTATETDAEKLAITYNTTTAGVIKGMIFSDSKFEQSVVNLIGSNVGSGTVNITNSATGHRTIDIVGSGELIRLRTTPHAISDTISFTSTLSNNFITFDGSANAAVQIKNSFIGIDLFNNTNGIRMLQNNREIDIDHRHLTSQAIRIVCPTGSSYNMIDIINPNRFGYHAINISTPSTGGGNALNLVAGHSGSYALNLANIHATGFALALSGILPEVPSPFDKDSLTVLDSIALIRAMMTNKRILNKDTATDSLYRNDGSTLMFTRSVSDDGTSQTVNASD